ncbi:DUF4190 domain-containing protein [Streptomyces paromomycinus]|uniref:DUF4190 domain-containing protein n=1 Tax=Streptomyces paromomycinus TaxID=92743 RepID=A0A401W005_STREY|nr:DUF4190 domain-containing protein [Streptomyces paromomycinus]GCD42673.1 hypothetical protein GKJPGBOP_02342 [Streptomyces paromomycinus]
MPPIPGAGADGQRPGAPYGAARPPYGSPQPPYGPAGAPYPGGHPGQQLPPGYQPYWAPAGPSNGYGTAALVLGIVGATLCFTMVIGFLLGVLAIVFGILGRAKVARGEADNGGSALAGVVLGGVALLLSGFMVCWVVLASAADEGGDDPWYPGYYDGGDSGGSSSGGSSSGGSGSEDDGPDTYQAAPAPGPRTYAAVSADPAAVPGLSAPSRGRLVVSA